MNNNNSSEIITNSDNKLVSNKSPQDEVETQTVSVIKTQKNNSLIITKWLMLSMAIVLTFTAFFLFGKETDVCFLSTCNDYSDSVGLEDTASSIGNDFVAYAGGAATLVVLTTLVGVPLMPAIIASAGVWFLLQMIN